jgi:hypothetical protein
MRYSRGTPARHRIVVPVNPDGEVAAGNHNPCRKEIALSMLRRTLALAGTTAATAALLLGPATAASAATSAEAMQISGSFFVVDDDGSSKPTARSDFSKTVFLTASSPRQTVVFNSACAGGEVHGQLALELILLSDGRVYVQDAPGGLGLKLFEGTSCTSTDLDGQANITDMVSFAGTTDTRSTSVGNQNEGGADLVSASFRVTHTHLS